MIDRQIVKKNIENKGACFEFSCHECPLVSCDNNYDSMRKAEKWLKEHHEKVLITDKMLSDIKDILMRAGDNKIDKWFVDQLIIKGYEVEKPKSKLEEARGIKSLKYLGSECIHDRIYVTEEAYEIKINAYEEAIKELQKEKE